MRYEFLNVCNDVTKTVTKIPQSEYLTEGIYPIYDQGKDIIGGYSNTDNGIASEYPYIVFGDHTRVIKYINNPCFIGADGVKLLKVVNNNFLPKYVYYSMIANPVESQGYSRHFKLLKETYIKYVDIVNQRKIIEELDNINNSILAKNYELETLDELIKSRFIEMFENKGFELLPIKEFVDIKKISAKKKFNSDEAIKYIDISLIDNERNVIKGYTNYLMKDAPSRAQQCLKKNDILISTVRPNLKNIAIFKDDDLYYVGSSGFCILRAKNVNYDYLKYVVLDDKFTNAMADLTTGASYPAIRDDDVLNYLMINAPIKLQNKFADFVQQIDKSKFIVQKEIKDLQELLDKKMDEYFRQ